MSQRRRALLAAACILAPFLGADVLHESSLAAVARVAWIGVLLLAAAAQTAHRRTRADHAARLVGLASGIAATIIVADCGGSRGLGFGFLYAVPFCALVLVPDLLSCAALAGLAATAGGCVLLLRDGQPAVEIVLFVARSAAMGGLATWGTVLYERMVQAQTTTDRQRTDALARLRDSEEKFAAAFSSTTLGALMIDENGVITAANPAMHAMLGVEVLAGRSYFDLLDPREVAAALETFDELRAANGAPSRERRRFATQRAAGHIEASVHAAPIRDSAGAMRSVIVMVEDVTDRVLLREQLATSEALFRDLAERAVVGVYVIQDGTFVYVNPRLAEIFGYTREELKGGVTTDMLTHPDDRALVRENLRKRVQLEAVSLNYEFRGLRKSGDVIEVAVFGTRTTYRARSAIIGTLLDVTDRNRVEEQRIRMQKLESLGVLAGGIAHDFNNLLAAILGDVSAAKERAAGDPVLLEVLAEAELAAARARGLTGQLLTFSRGGEPVKKPIDVRALLLEAASLAVRGSRSRCDHAIADDLWPVLADEGQLAQVVHNLVLNAVQAMVDGGVVTISAENVPAEASRLAGGARSIRVTVADTGPGVARDIAHRVFDPYFTTKKSGSGLGLATAHSIVTRHGGEIALVSGPLSGASFQLELPATSLEATATPPAKPLVAGMGRVVVMDDDELVRRAAMRLVASLGYEPLGAACGEEVLAMCGRERAAGRPIRAALIDLTVPNGMGGAETARLLREREPYIKAIVSSGYCSDSIMSDYAQHGFAGMISKPYSKEQLGAVLAAVLATPDLRDVA